MRARPLIPLFVLLIAAVTAPLLHGAATQSLHFPVAAPAAAAAGTDDLRIGLKAAALAPYNSGSIDLLSGDPASTVASKSAKALCLTAYTDGRSTCTRIVPGAACVGAACCDSFNAPALVIFDCVADNGRGFEVNLPLAGDNFTVSALPFGVGSIQNLTADNKNVYPDVGVDIASRSLIQLRPNGVTGNILLRVYHTQGGANPRVATVTVDATNNDPGESQALHDAARVALQGIAPALVPAIVATVHTVNDANYPLTSFGHLKQASHFLEITNVLPVGITKVEVVTVAGQGFTIEGTENTADTVADLAVPTLSEWGAILAAAVLMLMIYWVHRKRMRMQQAV